VVVALRNVFFLFAINPLFENGERRDNKKAFPADEKGFFITGPVKSQLILAEGYLLPKFL